MLENQIVQDHLDDAMQKCQEALEGSTTAYHRIYPPLDL